MKIKLDDKHYLNGDKHCYWVSEILIAKTSGKEYEQTCSGYYAKFSDAIISYYDTEFNSKDIKDIVELGEAMEDLKHEIHGWFETLDNQLKELIDKEYDNAD